MLVAGDDAQLRPILLGLEDRLPLPGQILEGGGLEQRLVELSALERCDDCPKLLRVPR